MKQYPNPGTDRKELTILMPCLNEEKTIGTCVGKALGFLERAGIDGEVLIADNGSTDRSRELAETAGARVVQVQQRGYGSALIGGISAAKGRFVIMGDADDSYDFSRLEGFVEQLRGGADLVMGNRFRGGIAPGMIRPPPDGNRHPCTRSCPSRSLSTKRGISRKS